MNKEEIKELARKSMIETIKTNLDSAMIFTYIKSLEDKIDKASKEVKELYEMAKEQDSDNVNLIDRLELVLNILTGEDNE